MIKTRKKKKRRKEGMVGRVKNKEGCKERLGMKCKKKKENKKEVGKKDTCMREEISQ